MAPTTPQASSLEIIRHISRSVSSSLLYSRSDASVPTSPLASIFALIISNGYNAASSNNAGISSRAAITPLIIRAPLASDLQFDTEIYNDLSKRQQQNVILAIPTTYQGLNAGPPPGTVVGIVLGAIGGFVLVLYFLLFAFRAYSGRVVSETIVTEKKKSPRRRASRPASEAAPATRRERRTTVIEERVTRSRSPDDEVIVEEEVSVDDDVVEVFEEHSPERRPGRKESKRTSGFRTVDPTQPGGGSAPMRKLGRR